MSYHPSGITIEIVLGTEASGNGRTCDAHDVCGSTLSDDVVVRLRKVQILNDSGAEETAIAVYLVSDCIDQCQVGFLQQHLLPHAKKYGGTLAHITEVYASDSKSPSKQKSIIIIAGVALLQSSHTFHQHQQVLLHQQLRTLVVQ